MDNQDKKVALIVIVVVMWICFWIGMQVSYPISRRTLNWTISRLVIAVLAPVFSLLSALFVNQASKY